MTHMFRVEPQAGFNFKGLVIDNFAGGGGASTGIEAALGRPVDIAVNHDPEAIRMHETNHPHTKHFCESVWDLDPREITQGRPVDLCWFSPDCKHFSKAKGAKPVEKKIRGLAWVAVRYAATVKPRVIMLENVEEFVTWGPVVDGQPCKKRKGNTFRSFVNALKRLGYQVDWKELVACDYGAPTSRKRFFLIARCDGNPIVWPKPTHGNPDSVLVRKGLLQPWKTAADIIDWSIPCPSIFERSKPLAENTLRRIARGIQKFVMDNPSPFIVNLTHGGRLEDINAPVKTITAANRGEKAVVEPYIVRIGQTGFGGDGLQYSKDQPLTTITSKAEHLLVAPTIERQFSASTGNAADKPLGTVTAGGGGKAALCAALIAKHNGGATGHKADDPLHTIVGRGTQLQLCTSHLVKFRGTCQHGQATDEPMPSITAGGNHIGEVRAFLLKYYGTNIGLDINGPIHSVTTKDRFGLITVHGEDYQIVDIGMRMLQPHELFAANSFPDDYIIDRDYTGKAMTKTSQVARCGNSVPPVMAEALVRANVAELERLEVA